MGNDLIRVLEAIGAEHAEQIQETARYYREVDIGRQAQRMGLSDLAERYRNTNAIVLIKDYEGGMTVRVDGRTFVGYARLHNKIVVPGHVARDAGVPFKPYTAMDSMVLVF